MRLRSLHSLAFFLGEAITPEQSGHARRVSVYIYKRIKPAIDDFALWRFHGAGRQANPKGMFIRILSKTWQPRQGNRFYIDPELYHGEIPIILIITNTGGGTYFTFYSDKEKTQPAFGGIKLDVAIIERARNWSEMSNAVMDIFGKIMHEPVHIHNLKHTPGKQLYHSLNQTTKELSGAASTPKKTMDAWRAAISSNDVVTARKMNVDASQRHMNYLTNEVEIEAYARQFSMLFHRVYPGQRYSLPLMQKITTKLRNKLRKNVYGNAIYYFHLMRQPGWYNWKDKTGRQPYKETAKSMDRLMVELVDELLTL